MILLLPRGAVAFAGLPAGAATTHNGRRTTTSPVNRTRVRAFLGRRAEPALVVVEEPKRRPLDPSPLGGADSASRAAA